MHAWFFSFLVACEPSLFGSKQFFPAGGSNYSKRLSILFHFYLLTNSLYFFNYELISKLFFIMLFECLWFCSGFFSFCSNNVLFLRYSSKELFINAVYLLIFLSRFWSTPDVWWWFFFIIPTAFELDLFISWFYFKISWFNGSIVLFF